MPPLQNCPEKLPVPEDTDAVEICPPPDQSFGPSVALPNLRPFVLALDLAPPEGNRPVTSAELPPPMVILDPPVFNGETQVPMVFMQVAHVSTVPTPSPSESAQIEIPPSSGLDAPGV